MNRNGCDIRVRTSQFNLSEPRAHFINECCFGEDFAKWLIARLPEVGVCPGKLYQEDWGWEFTARQGDNCYYVGVGGLSDEDPADPNRGEFRIMVSKRRGFLGRLLGREAMPPDAPILSAIEILLSREAGFADLNRE